MEAPPLVGSAERDALFRLLVENVKDYAIFLLDPGGRVMTWNLGAERIKGYRADEILGQHFSRFYPEQDVRTGKPLRGLALAESEGRFADEGWRIRKDGSRFWASVVITALRGHETGELVGFAKVTRDLTERKRADEERIQLLKREAEARERAAVAEAEVRARDEFIAIAAHELRTPITAVKAGVQLVLRRASRGSPLPPATRSALEHVERAADRLTIFITHLLESVRIHAGRVELELGPMDVAALVREVCATLASSTGRRIDVSGPRSMETVADRLRLEQVVTNLVDNAAKYSPLEAPIEVTLARAGDMAEIAVRDHGSGVAPEQRARLFERYFRAHEDQSGIGLGLYITREIVEKHGGVIRAEFPEDGGSRFVVTLPVDARVAGPRPDLPPAAAGTGA